METKHTPGPWDYSPMKGTKGHCFMAQVWDGEGKSLAIIESDRGEAVATATAKLIACTPDLLNALTAIVLETEQKHAEDVAYADRHNNSDGVGISFDYYSPSPLPQWVIEARAIIKKATE